VKAHTQKKSNRPSVLVTAGPTRERIDPVRFISNYSTGKFGYEISREARRRGCRVTLISGPTCLRPPRGVRCLSIESARELRKAVASEFKEHDCLIMAAAVSDWRPRQEKKAKIKRAPGKGITIEFAENPDILREIGRKKGKKIVVGFALETMNLEKNAIKKMKEKSLDIIVANKLSGRSNAFGDHMTNILMINRLGHKTAVRAKSKKELAKIILDNVLNFNI
jgi:phosphopantothenoylcysteine decarboxylase/phosphopantothenate--cysteine ligase